MADQEKDPKWIRKFTKITLTIIKSRRKVSPIIMPLSVEKAGCWQLYVPVPPPCLRTDIFNFRPKRMLGGETMLRSVGEKVMHSKRVFRVPMASPDVTPGLDS
ncbi:hypothetical protein WISP_139806 [Willisornis vidua]|uniref:Uncharacterized protein n=1 Tax=Willisornis vidua TaxID=1566151 RepID=A0ABQ9CRT8_9PASS|nr:hypothetical protein WISP_139806 [Willisornis vidua]